MKKVKAVTEDTLHRMMRHRAVLRRAMKQVLRAVTLESKSDAIMLIDAALKETDL